MSLTEPPRWNDQQFEEQRTIASAAFCEERLREPVESNTAKSSTATQRASGPC